MEHLRFKNQKFDDNIYMRVIYYVYCFLMMNLGLLLLNIPLFISINFVQLTTRNIALLWASMILVYPAIASIFSAINHYLEVRDIKPFRYFFFQGLKDFWLFGLKYGVATAVLLWAFSSDMMIFYGLPFAQISLPFFIIMFGAALALSVNMVYFRIRNRTAREHDVLRIAAYYLIKKWYVGLLNAALFILMLGMMFYKPQFGFIITPSIFLFIMYLNCRKLHQTTM